MGSSKIGLTGARRPPSRLGNFEREPVSNIDVDQLRRSDARGPRRMPACVQTKDLPAFHGYSCDDRRAEVGFVPNSVWQGGCCRLWYPTLFHLLPPLRARPQPPTCSNGRRAWRTMLASPGGRQSADQRGLRLLAQGFQVCPVILDHCVSLDSLEPPACKMNSCNRGAASLILWQQQLSIEVFVLWSNSSSQNSGTSSRPTSGARTMRISQFPAEASETDGAGLPSGMHESRT
jgi:hypothetical protein